MADAPPPPAGDDGAAVGGTTSPRARATEGAPDIGGLGGVSPRRRGAPTPRTWPSATTPLKDWMPGLGQGALFVERSLAKSRAAAINKDGLKAVKDPRLSDARALGLDDGEEVLLAADVVSFAGLARGANLVRSLDGPENAEDDRFRLVHYVEDASWVVRVTASTAKNVAVLYVVPGGHGANDVAMGLESIACTVGQGPERWRVTLRAVHDNVRNQLQLPAYEELCFKLRRLHALIGIEPVDKIPRVDLESQEAGELHRNFVVRFNDMVQVFDDQNLSYNDRKLLQKELMGYMSHFMAAFEDEPLALWDVCVSVATLVRRECVTVGVITDMVRSRIFALLTVGARLLAHDRTPAVRVYMRLVAGLSSELVSPYNSAIAFTNMKSLLDAIVEGLDLRYEENSDHELGSLFLDAVRLARGGVASHAVIAAFSMDEDVRERLQSVGIKADRFTLRALWRNTDFAAFRTGLTLVMSMDVDKDSDNPFARSFRSAVFNEEDLRMPAARSSVLRLEVARVEYAFDAALDRAVQAIRTANAESRDPSGAIEAKRLVILCNALAGFNSILHIRSKLVEGDSLDKFREVLHVGGRWTREDMGVNELTSVAYWKCYPEVNSLAAPITDPRRRAAGATNVGGAGAVNAEQRAKLESRMTRMLNVLALLSHAGDAPVEDDNVLGQALRLGFASLALRPNLTTRVLETVVKKRPFSSSGDGATLEAWIRDTLSRAVVKVIEYIDSTHPDADLDADGGANHRDIIESELDPTAPQRTSEHPGDPPQAPPAPNTRNDGFAGDVDILTSVFLTHQENHQLPGSVEPPLEVGRFLRTMGPGLGRWVDDGLIILTTAWRSRDARREYRALRALKEYLTASACFSLSNALHRINLHLRTLKMVVRVGARAEFKLNQRIAEHGGRWADASLISACPVELTPSFARGRPDLAGFRASNVPLLLEPAGADFPAGMHVPRVALFTAQLDGMPEKAGSSGAAGWVAWATAISTTSAGKRLDAMHAMEEALRFSVAKKVVALCQDRVLREILGSARPADILDVAAQLGRTVERELEELLFTFEEFRSGFVDKNQPSISGAAFPLNDVANTTNDAEDLGPHATIRSIQDKFADLCREVERMHPDHAPRFATLKYNQMLACHSIRELGAQRDVLLRLGTGQGKSIVLLLAAIDECQRSKRRVVLLTSFHRLAERDYESCKDMIEAAGLTSCLVRMPKRSAPADPKNHQLEHGNDLVGIGAADIIFSDVWSFTQSIDLAMRDVLSGATGSHSNAAELLRLAYPSMKQPSPYSVLCDEIDLLNDIGPYGPLVYSDKSEPLPVTVNEVNLWSGEFAPRLWSVRNLPRLDATNADRNLDAGVEQASTDVYHVQDDQGNYFKLPYAAWSLREFVMNAERIIGVTGTGTLEDVTWLMGSRRHNRPQPATQPNQQDMASLVLPSSSNPSTFTTLVLPRKSEDNPNPYAQLTPFNGSPEALHGEHGIWLRTRRVVLRKEFHTLREAQYDWIDKVVEEVRSVRNEKRNVYDDGSEWTPWGATSTAGQGDFRPVIVYVDVDERLEGGGGISVGKAVSNALVQAFPGVHVQVILDNDMTSDQLQRIGQSNIITVTHILFGRGLDIFVHPDVQGGLHVVVATAVAHERLLLQVVGRTGRMGRDGSYSIIVLDQIIRSPARRTTDSAKALLAVATSLAVEKLLRSPDGAPSGHALREWGVKWRMFLLQASVEVALASAAQGAAHVPGLFKRACFAALLQGTPAYDLVTGPRGALRDAMVGQWRVR